MTTHAEARKLATQGYLAKFGSSPIDELPPLSVLQCLQGVGFLETTYGDGWSGAGRSSFNMGAITAGSEWTGQTFENKDSYPDSSGISHWYVTKFRVYPTAEAGWADLAAVMYGGRRSIVLAAAQRADLYAVSESLYSTHYYAGFGATAEARIDGHYRSLLRAVRLQCLALNEPLPLPHGTPIVVPVDPAKPLPILRRGDRGPAVKQLQELLNVQIRSGLSCSSKELVQDGIFGPMTQDIVRAFQLKSGLKQDGVVGPLTWAALGVKDLTHAIP